MKELKHSIFTHCHSHSGRIINTQTHSHTYCMHALCVCMCTCWHTRSLSVLYSEGMYKYDCCSAEVKCSLLTFNGWMMWILLVFVVAHDGIYCVYLGNIFLFHWECFIFYKQYQHKTSKYTKAILESATISYILPKLSIITSFKELKRFNTEKAKVAAVNIIQCTVDSKSKHNLTEKLVVSTDLHPESFLCRYSINILACTSWLAANMLVYRLKPELSTNF